MYACYVDQVMMGIEMNTFLTCYTLMDEYQRVPFTYSELKSNAKTDRQIIVSVIENVTCKSYMDTSDIK